MNPGEALDYLNKLLWLAKLTGPERQQVAIAIKAIDKALMAKAEEASNDNPKEPGK